MRTWQRDSLIVGTVNLALGIYVATYSCMEVLGNTYVLLLTNAALCLGGIVIAGIRLARGKGNVFPYIVWSFLLPMTGLVLTIVVLAMIPTKGPC